MKAVKELRELVEEYLPNTRRLTWLNLRVKFNPAIGNPERLAELNRAIGLMSNLTQQQFLHRLVAIWHRPEVSVLHEELLSLFGGEIAPFLSQSLDYFEGHDFLHLFCRQKQQSIWFCRIYKEAW